MPARSLPAHGCAVSEPRSALTSVAGQEPGDRDRGGALLLGYFLLGKQEKVTRPPGWRTEKHTDVFSRKPKGSKQKQMDPGFRRDDGVGRLVETTAELDSCLRQDDDGDASAK